MKKNEDFSKKNRHTFCSFKKRLYLCIAIEKNNGSLAQLNRTHEPHEYYCKLPAPIDQRKIFVVDPMLATGGSAVAAIDFIKQHGGKDITFMCVIAAPEGVEKLQKAHPDIKIFIGNLDRQLNENAYICPGLGDAGDRIFGTK